MKTLTSFLFCLFLTAWTFCSQAAMETFGDYTVYYQAVNSTFLNADIAEQYGIVRSDRRAFLNISVMKKSDDEKMTAVRARVDGGKRNLLGETSDIEFREIREENALYYIGEFEYSNAENVRFSVEVQPEFSGPAREIRWETQMYNN